MNNAMKSGAARCGAPLIAAALALTVMAHPQAAAAQGTIPRPEAPIDAILDTAGDFSVMAAQERGRFRSSTDDGVVTAPSRPWTLEEMRAAKPRDLPTVKGSPTPIAASTVEAAGEPGAIPARLPNGQPVIRLTERGDDPTGLAEADDLILRPSALSVAIPPSSYTKVPLRSMGKLFFRSQDGESSVCSAASIGERAIWTAGHCLHAGNNSEDGWFTSVVFVPAYRNGNAPFGQWPVNSTQVDRRYFATGSQGDDSGPGIRWDYGGGITALRGGRKLSQAVGALGFTWNRPTSTQWLAFGWPAEPPFEGESLFRCSGVIRHVDEDFSPPRPRGIACDMTGGASGGPWITPRLELGGNNSYSPGDLPIMFTPFYTAETKSLRDCLVLRNGVRCANAVTPPEPN